VDGWMAGWAPGNHVLLHSYIPPLYDQRAALLRAVQPQRLFNIRLAIFAVLPCTAWAPSGVDHLAEPCRHAVGPRRTCLRCANHPEAAGGSRGTRTGRRRRSHKQRTWLHLPALPSLLRLPEVSWVARDRDRGSGGILACRIYQTRKLLQHIDLGHRPGLWEGEAALRSGLRVGRSTAWRRRGTEDFDRGMGGQRNRNHEEGEAKEARDLPLASDFSRLPPRPLSSLHSPVLNSPVVVRLSQGALILALTCS